MKSGTGLGLPLKLPTLRLTSSEEKLDTPLGENLRQRVNSSGLSIDKLEMAHDLISELKDPLMMNDVLLGWKLNDGEKSIQEGVAKKIIITFLGTSSLPYFSEHKVMYEGGDALCQLTLQEAIIHKQPCLLVDGVGTKKLSKEDKYYPIDSMFNPNTDYLGNISEVIKGTGIADRITCATNNFIIPTLLKIILANYKEASTQRETIYLDIIGHSRGAITSYYQINVINKFIEIILKNEKNSINYKDIAKNAGMDKKDVSRAIELLRKQRFQCKINALLFDPVEGMTKSYDASSFLGNETTIKIKLIGVAQLLETNCSIMPAIVEKAQINLGEAERRLIFRPTLPKFNPNTHLRILVVDGVHSTMIGNIGNHDGDGQDALESVKNNRFNKEAIMASIDLIKIESLQFLHADVPSPLQRHMLRRIFREESDMEYAYNTVHQFLSYHLDHNMKYNLEFQVFITKKMSQLLRESCTTIANIEEIFKTNNDLKIKGCEWLMTKDKVLARKVYFLMRKDICELYLFPQDPLKKLLLKERRDEQKRDSTTLAVGFISGSKYKMQVQGVEEARQVYIRDLNDKKKEYFYSKKLDEVFPEFFSSDKQLADPYFCILSSQLGNKRGYYFHVFDLQLELDMVFYEINALILQCASQQGNVYEQLLSRLIALCIEFLDLLVKHSTDEYFSQLACYCLVKKINEFKGDEKANILSTIQEKLKLCAKEQLYFKAQLLLVKDNFLTSLSAALNNYKVQNNNTLNDKEQILEKNIEEWKRCQNADRVVLLFKTMNREILSLKDVVEKFPVLSKTVQRNKAFVQLLEGLLIELKRYDTLVDDLKGKMLACKVPVIQFCTKEPELVLFSQNSQRSTRSARNCDITISKKQRNSKPNIISPNNRDFILSQSTSRPKINTNAEKPNTNDSEMTELAENFDKKVSLKGNKK